MARLIEDVGALIRHVDSDTMLPRRKAFGQDTHFGQVTVTSHPKGVCLIVANSNDPLTLGIAALATSIAARNAVVLVSTQPTNHHIFAILERELSSYLDQTAVHVLATVDSSDIIAGAEDLDDAFIIGECLCNFVLVTIPGLSKGFIKTSVDEVYRLYSHWLGVTQSLTLGTAE